MHVFWQNATTELQLHETRYALALTKLNRQNNAHSPMKITVIKDIHDK